MNHHIKQTMTAGLLAVSLVGCAIMPTPNTKPTITKADFGKTPEGQAVELYTLHNSRGAEARIMTYGGIVQSLSMPDKHGKFGDIVLGYDNLQGYIDKTPYFGALIGRYGNRIGGAKFTLDGKAYKLAKNDGNNSLHGGPTGFFHRLFTGKTLPDGGVELTYVSKDGEEGFPGTLTATITYHLTDANELKIEYAATTDKATVVNLTNHSYFNLKGAGEGDVLGHVVTINASKFTPVDKGLIPTGELKPVAGTPFDFTKPTAIGARIEQKDEQLIFGKGYDHNWVLDRTGDGMSLAARVEEPASGRVMEVFTTEPGLQFYTGNFMDGSKGKGGKAYPLRGAFCMETQHYPDSPNKPKFPTTTVKPGEKYQTTTVYKFSVAGAPAEKK
jgi:aldose 1-epimerase